MSTVQNTKKPAAKSLPPPPPAKKSDDLVDDFDLPEDDEPNKTGTAAMKTEDEIDTEVDDFMDSVAAEPLLPPPPPPHPPVAKKSATGSTSSSSSSKKRKSPATEVTEKSPEEKEAERQKKMDAVKLAGENYLTIHTTIKNRPILIAVPGLGKAYLKHLVEAYRNNGANGQHLDSQILPLAQKASDICALHEPHDKVLENDESTAEQKAKATEAIAQLPKKPRVNDWMILHLVPSFDPNKITAQGYHIRVKLIGPVHNHKPLEKIDSVNFFEQLPLSSISTTFKNINLPVASYSDSTGLATRCKPVLHWNKFQLVAPDATGRQLKTPLSEILPFGVLTGEETLSWSEEQKTLLNRACIYTQKMFSGIDDYKTLATEQQEYWDAYKTARQRDRKAMKDRFNVELPDHAPCWFDHLQQRLEKADPSKDQSRIIYGANSIYNQESRRDRSAAATGKKKASGGGAGSSSSSNPASSSAASSGDGESGLAREDQAQLFQSSLFPLNYVGRTYLHWIQQHSSVHDAAFDRLAGINAAISSNVIAIQPPAENVCVRNSLLIRVQDELTGEVKFGFAGSVNPQSMALVGAQYWQYHRVLQVNAHLLATRQAFNKQPTLFEEQFNTIVSNATNLTSHYTEPLVTLLLSHSPDVRNLLQWLEFEDWNHFVSVVGPELCNSPNLWDPVHQRPMANAALNIILYMTQHNLGGSAVENLMNWLDKQMQNYLNYSACAEFTPSELLQQASLATPASTTTTTATAVAPAGLLTIPGLVLPSVNVPAPVPKRIRHR